MRFDYYQLIDGDGARPELQRIEDAGFDAPYSNGIENLRAAVMENFAGLVRQRPETGIIVVISRTIGEPPGAIVAAEVSSAVRSSGRRLEWLYEDWISTTG